MYVWFLQFWTSKMLFTFTVITSRVPTLLLLNLVKWSTLIKGPLEQEILTGISLENYI